MRCVVGQAKIKYPPHLLDEEIEDFIKGLEKNLERDHLDLETYLKMREMDRETFIEKEVKSAAARRLERSLVLEEFAHRENIEVKSDEVRSIYYSALQQLQQTQETRKAQAKNRRSTEEMANSLAINTVNNIYNQRMMTRLKAIAAGKGDEPEVVEPVEAAIFSETASLPAEELPAVEMQLPAEQPEEEQAAHEEDGLAQEPEQGDADSTPAGETSENEA
jgi:hypothetical protein